ncbi:KTSC domain-containing protein [Wenyingzhuangia sp. 2_MG-2023]|uniref:KTSC domain-containing protein n=1 Tax=Wenyingzhuangia sp. 2_MG-2023 TaxID=3062639 RepID=UPI0026E14DCB|nr:KTSC domain-containing protein [Wenyingzhuangia sp. 2_MG-2023]MDO6737155.1 KTSC domain-containing protein [Wenyingzhuangia sp. 2_MG-2023]MDO6801769.1 KTSC domain-containing protein [Wenyingzhuangia sp. 1_MG-2023]
MKRINEYKKLFNVQGAIDLKEIKTTYRGLVKKYHPDKFQDEQEKEEAGEISLKIIDGYHFLVSIAPETKEANLEAYTKTIKESYIEDFKHKSMLMEITFSDGNVYEYFGVNKALYTKFLNTPQRANFARRKIFNSFIYRKAMKASELV